MSSRHATPEELGAAQDSVVTHGPGDEFEIEVVSDVPEEDRDRPPPAPDYEPEEASEDELAELGGRAQKRIKKLRWEYHEERRAKEAAERLSQEAVEFGKTLTSENEKLRGALAQTQKALNEQASRRADGALKAAEEAFKIAYAENDADRIAEAQKAMTSALMAKSFAPSVANKVMRDYTSQYDAAQGGSNEVAGKAPVKEPDLPYTPPEPDEKTKAWMKRNPWFGDGPERDRVMSSTALGIHEKLIVEEGIVPETDEYYDRLDREMRQIFPNKFEASPTPPGRNMTEVVVTQASQPPARQRADTVVAPATRNNGARAPQKIILTETQVALAKRIGVPLEEYAKQVMATERSNVQ